MARLRTALEATGLQSVKTLLNSGNVVFAHDGAPGKLGALIENTIEGEVGFRPTVVVMSAADLRKVVKANPFPAMAKDDPSHLVAMFFSGKPRKDAGARLAA